MEIFGDRELLPVHRTKEEINSIAELMSDIACETRLAKNQFKQMIPKITQMLNWAKTLIHLKQNE